MKRLHGWLWKFLSFLGLKGLELLADETVRLPADLAAVLNREVHPSWHAVPLHTPVLPPPLRLGPKALAGFAALEQLQRTDAVRYCAVHGALLHRIDWGRA